ncbi:mycothiol synthase [Kineosphaera limosa]|uniref:Mycothiol acetyltransferase n=1 Tax=Kineosphaera limosa NBRC 100340 TaxID=1184609 RepID=K6XAM9_9MICO|nr:mycothiol synthase [Kineosphaera limosa]NYD99753.1 mycothiol synthase [Kineosphaera limosa]GAB95854.1 acetyltransferase MshD [Kineosphaera limosa NBRC 100340]
MLRATAVLTEHEQRQVHALITNARIQDGVSPASEQTLLRLPATGAGEWLHLLYQRNDDLLGYAHLDTSDANAPWAELVVAPLSRRRGIGTQMLRDLQERAPQVRLWAHGFLPSTSNFAITRRLRVVRELWQMARPLADLPQGRPLADGFEVSTLTPGNERDEQDWVQVNAAAFATHPEQGRMTRADLQERQGEPWFDPAGFFLVRDARPGPTKGSLAAFHWTKVERGVGEVYVVGVDPAYQGHGLGTAVTWIGLNHLRQEGLERVTLYVDGNNAAAIATYRRLGFERIGLDVQLAAAGVSGRGGR